jgi:predicted RNase H-like nuclease
MFVVGVDGCKKGWLGIRIASSKDWEIEVFEKFYLLWEKYQDASLILVDIPIGLLDDAHGRPCDWLARRILGSRYRSVFPVPCRPAVHAATYDEAIKVNEKRTGSRIFRATWNIMGKISEVENFLLRTPKARNSVREVHPEICFWALNNHKPTKYSKTKKGEKGKGFEERVGILESVFPNTNDIINEGLFKYKRKDVAPDDILDALAAAITGLLGSTRLKTLPENPGRDAHGLPMEMVYFIPES